MILGAASDGRRNGHSLEGGRGGDAGPPLVSVVIVNWNGWGDTIECLESVFRLDYPNLSVIVCDNGSQDNSLEKIRAWARGDIDVVSFGQPSLRTCSFPPVAKPIEYCDLNAAESGAPNFRGEPSKLTLIDVGENRGFAGGNNVGICYATEKRDATYVWLLNNDTVVEHTALDHMVARMEEQATFGICGSVLRYYDAPCCIQALGGAFFNKWLAISRHHTEDRPVSQSKYFSLNGPRTPDYIIGASMLVSKKFIDRVGLMGEEYFIYYEEIDWCIRGKRKGFSLTYSPESIVYHKDGRSTGAGVNVFTRNPVADYYNIRNRIVFTRKYFPYAMVTVVLGILLAIVNRIRRRQWSLIPVVTRAFSDAMGLTKPWSGAPGNAQLRIGQ